MADANLDEQIGAVHLTVDHLNNGGVLLLSPDGQMLESTLSNTQDQPVRVLTLGSEFVITQFKEASSFVNSNGVILKLNTENVLNAAKTSNNLERDLPEPKRAKISDPSEDSSVQQLLSTIQQSLVERLECVEKKLSNVMQLCNNVQEKIEGVISEVREVGFTTRLALASDSKNQGTIILGTSSTQAVNENPGNRSSGRLVILSSESDFPHGSWLGNPEDPEARVRCHVPERELEKINQTCPTPEKMALTLLDYLFDRETQACSNISGTGRHGKKQLDPLKVYGIKCHLIHRFHITDKDWHRIKQNLDSKCRTAFRRKQKGMPLTVKAFRETVIPTNIFQGVDATESENSISVPGQEQNTQMQSINNFEIIHDTSSQEIINQDLDLSTAIPVALHTAHGNTVSLPIRHLAAGSQVIHTEHGDIEVVHATPEQLVQMQQTHQIQILTGAEVLGELQEQSTSSLLQSHA